MKLLYGDIMPVLRLEYQGYSALEGEAHYFVSEYGSDDYILLSKNALYVLGKFTMLSINIRDQEYVKTGYAILVNLSIDAGCLSYKDMPVLYGSCVSVQGFMLLFFDEYAIVFITEAALVFRRGSLDFVGSVSNHMRGVFSHEVAKLVLKLKELDFCGIS